MAVDDFPVVRRELSSWGFPEESRNHNENDLFLPVGWEALKWWWNPGIRKSLQKCPDHSGLGIIVICLPWATQTYIFRGFYGK